MKDNCTERVIDVSFWFLLHHLNGGGGGGCDGGGGGGGCFLACEDFGRMLDNLFPACGFLLFF